MYMDITNGCCCLWIGPLSDWPFCVAYGASACYIVVVRVCVICSHCLLVVTTLWGSVGHTACCCSTYLPMLSWPHSVVTHTVCVPHDQKVPCSNPVWVADSCCMYTIYQYICDHWWSRVVSSSPFHIFPILIMFYMGWRLISHWPISQWLPAKQFG